MNDFTVGVPLLLSLVAVLVAVLPLPKRVHPATIARLITILMLGAGLSAYAWAAVKVGAFLASGAPPPVVRIPGVELLAAHTGPWYVTCGAVGLLLVSTVSAAVAACRARRALAPAMPLSDVVLADSAEIAAYAVPGRNGHVVISRGLADEVSSDEFEVVLAHERSHLCNRHHLHLLAARLGVAGAPWLRPLLGVARFHLERWADEDAAAAVGDREMVACTIAKVALAAHVGRPPALGFGGRHALRRVEALLDAPPPTVTLADSLATLGTRAAATGMVGSAMHLHHVLHL